MGLSHRLIICKHHIVKLSIPIVYIAYQYCSTIRIINPYQYPIIAPPKMDRNVIQTPKDRPPKNCFSILLGDYY